MSLRPAPSAIALAIAASSALGGLPAAVLDSEALRLEQGRHLAQGREMRLWTFAPFPEPMQDWPSQVRGAFVELRCEDHPFSEAALILLRDDFRLRSYPARLLKPEDRALAGEMETRRHQALARTPGARPYALAPAPYTTQTAHIVESPHFAFIYGDDRLGSGKAAFTDSRFMERQQQWFEKVWCHLAELGAPMPMVQDEHPRKINVYITGTGLKHHADGFAFGGENVVMHPNALGEGSSVVIHEFTHSIQFYSKGYRNSPFVGWFWECHANWSTHQFMPAYPPVLAHYTERAHYELNSSRHNYGSWPFLQVLAEDPRFGPGFPYDLWPACRRKADDGALEDPFQTIMRLGMERHIWTNGVEGFGDTIGELAARMVGWDFQNQYYELKDIRLDERTDARIPSTRTLVEAVADRPGWWRPIHSQAPKQYGVNIIDLEPLEAQVAVDLAGIVDDTEGGDWRVTLVACTPQGGARYSPTVHGGRLALDVRPGERLALAVAAAPTSYKSLEFRPGYAVKRRYPYEFAVQGARPSARPPGLRARTAEGARHANGGGFVARSATVAATAYVGPEAAVLDGARVGGRARIEDHAVVRHAAHIDDEAVVGGYAHVNDQATVSGHARIGGYACLGRKAVLTGNARLLEYATIDGEGVVGGDALVKGFGEIHLSPATELAGGLIAGEDLEVHCAGSALPRIESGLLYGYLNADLMKNRKELGDNRGLYAQWDFAAGHGQVLRDVNADCDGVFRGTPVLARDASGPYWELDGRSSAMVEGHVIAARNLAFDLRLWWNGDAGAQTLFAFGTAPRRLTLGVDAQGRVLVQLQAPPASAAILSSTPLPPRLWVRLGVVIRDGVGTLLLDGRTVGESRGLAVLPDDIRAAAGILGADFHGRLGEVKVYRTGVIPGSPPGAAGP